MIQSQYVECWENQRWHYKNGFSPYRLRTDRPLWSDKAGLLTIHKDAFLLPIGWQWLGPWYVMPHGNNDDGWYYAPDYKVSTKHCSEHQQKMSFVRRRRWVRERVFVPEGITDCIAEEEKARKEIAEKRKKERELEEQQKKRDSEEQQRRAAEEEENEVDEIIRQESQRAQQNDDQEDQKPEEEETAAAAAASSSSSSAVTVLSSSAEVTGTLRGVPLPPAVIALVYSYMEAEQGGGSTTTSENGTSENEQGRGEGQRGILSPSTIPALPPSVVGIVASFVGRPETEEATADNDTDETAAAATSPSDHVVAVSQSDANKASSTSKGEGKEEKKEEEEVDRRIKTAAAVASVEGAGDQAGIPKLSGETVLQQSRHKNNVAIMQFALSGISGQDSLDQVNDACRAQQQEASDDASSSLSPFVHRSIVSIETLTEPFNHLLVEVDLTKSVQSGSGQSFSSEVVEQLWREVHSRVVTAVHLFANKGIGLLIRSSSQLLPSSPTHTSSSTSSSTTPATDVNASTNASSSLVSGGDGICSGGSEEDDDAVLVILPSVMDTESEIIGAADGSAVVVGGLVGGNHLVIFGDQDLHRTRQGIDLEFKQRLESGNSNTNGDKSHGSHQKSSSSNSNSSISTRAFHRARSLDDQSSFFDDEGKYAAIGLSDDVPSRSITAQPLQQQDHQERNNVQTLKSDDQDGSSAESNANSDNATDATNTATPSGKHEKKEQQLHFVGDVTSEEHAAEVAEAIKKKKALDEEVQRRLRPNRDLGLLDDDDSDTDDGQSGEEGTVEKTKEEGLNDNDTSHQPEHDAKTEKNKETEEKGHLPSLRETNSNSNPKPASTTSGAASEHGSSTNHNKKNTNTNKTNELVMPSRPEDLTVQPFDASQHAMPLRYVEVMCYGFPGSPREARAADTVRQHESFLVFDPMLKDFFTQRAKNADTPGGPSTPRILQLPKSSLKTLYYFGLPNSLRGPMWVALSGACEKRDAAPGYYPEVNAACDEYFAHPDRRDVLQEIEQDVVRTAPAHPLFNIGRGPAADRLRSQLKCFLLHSQRDYHQAYSYILAAIIINVESDLDAFWLMATLMSDGGILPHGYYDNDILDFDLGLLPSLADQALSPALVHHMRTKGLELAVPANGWIQALFCAHMPLSSACRVLDLVFAEHDPSVILRLTIAFVKMHAEDIFDIDDLGSFGGFANKWCRNEWNPDALMKVAWELQYLSDTVKSLRKKNGITV